ncbi:MAG: hypothetical protein NXH97_05365 [Rhodobacteraceae bacterium]|nr:hypothetical protein [Paracoccaceae bacterium]
MTANWPESPAQKVYRLTQERDEANDRWREARAKLSESRRKWELLAWALWAVALTNMAVLIVGELK